MRGVHMKKKMIFLSFVAILVVYGSAFSQVNPAQVNPGPAVPSQEDYATIIIGTWKFDLGSGYLSTIDYLSDGTFIQQVDELIVKGTYKVSGKTLKTVTRGRATLFTIVSFENNKLTIKRVRDGRTIVYEKQ